MQIGAHEVASEQKKTQVGFFLRCGGQTPELVAQNRCGGFILGDVQNLPRHGPEQPPPAEPV